MARASRKGRRAARPRGGAETEHEELTRLRPRFPILRRKNYLINNSLGAMPAATYDALREFADAWAHEGVLAWDDWLPMVVESGNRVGKLMGAPPGSVMMHQNVSTLVGIVLSALDYRERNAIVATDLNFPSVLYNLYEQERRGARVVLVPGGGLNVDTQRVVEAIDDQTALVCLDLVLFRSSGLLDVAPIVEAAHRHGALLLLDVYQAIGAVPIDVAALGVDFAVGGSVKWLCGGPGAAYLYVAEWARRNLRPAATGWFSHKRPFAFEVGRVDPADDIHRYMGGSPSVPALYSARSGYEVVAEVGVKRIRARSLSLTERLIQGADAQGLTVNTPRDPARRGGTVCVDFEGADVAHDELIERGILIDYRPNCGIRVSPHFYNTAAECDAVLEAIAEIRASRRFQGRLRQRPARAAAATR
ncbi:MAG TPA: aminotransferase class V-fold PLP-dependent enzyme [Myxococcales bacterium]|nr:aminotransferase class V-fold PLP-dependent enzyme [Myxococcales bacterium]